jgi:hypothetical protein
MELADFQQRVGWRLGIIRAAEPLSPEDAKIIGDTYAELWHELLEHELVDWQVDDAIPDRAAHILVGMTVARLVDEFGMAEPRRTAIVMECSYGLPAASPYERRLRAMSAVGYDESPVEADYF